MKNTEKTKEQLLKEIEKLNKRIVELKKFENEHIRAEETLQESETRYKNLYSMMRLMSDNLPDLIWTKDVEGKFLFVNKACSKILLNAKDTDEPIGKTDIYFANREKELHSGNTDYHTFGEKCTDSDQAVLDSKKPLRFDESGNVKGKFMFLDVYKAPFEDENGDIIGTVGSAKDVTKERQMENKLQESEKKLTQIIEGSSTPIFVINKKHIITHWNKACEKLTGVSAKKMTGTKKHWTAFYSAERPLLADIIVDNFTEAEIAKYYNNKFRKSTFIEGAYDCEDFYPELDNKWLFFTAAPLKDQKGNVVGAIETFQDITERKQAEDKLNKINRLYATLSRINQSIVIERDKQQLFQEICNIVIEFGKFKLAWIGFVDEENKLIKPIAFSGEGSDYLQNIKISLNSDITRKGPTGRSILEGKSIVFNDLENNPDFVPWRKQALVKGYRSSAAFPIQLNNIVIAALNIYAVEPHFFDEDEINLLEEAAMGISFALEKFKEEENRKQVEEELEKHHENLEELVKERTKELEEKNKELERMNDLFVGREFRIKELRDKVKELEKSKNENGRE